jgi:hypothetical protein
MTYKEARNLLKMTVVMWDDNPDDTGTVLEVRPDAFFVNWADGQRGWIHCRDARRVSIHQHLKTYNVRKALS